MGKVSKIFYFSEEGRMTIRAKNYENILKFGNCMCALYTLTFYLLIHLLTIYEV